MFTKSVPTEPTRLENVIDDILVKMQSHDAHTKEYSALADQLVKLYKLKEVDIPKRVSPDTLALIAGNLAGIMIIIGYERVNIVTSKALSFVMKAR